VEQQFHVVFICVERGEIPGARIARGNEIFSNAPSEFRLAVLYGDDVGDHSRMTAVSIRERMNSRQLVMKTKQRFVHRERFVFQPVSRVGDKLEYSLRDLFRVATDVLLRLTVGTRPFRDVVEHAMVQFPDVRFCGSVRGGRGFHRSTPKRQAIT
jgi:hypothetical protein